MPDTLTKELIESESYTKKDKKLLRNAIAVFSVVSEKSVRNKCYLKNIEIAQITGLSVPDVWRAKKKLRSLGIITESRTRISGRFIGRLETVICV